MEDIEYIGKIGLDFAEISLLDPVQDRAKIAVWKQLQDKYQLNYLAHGAKEGDPFQLQNLQEVFAPNMKSLIDLAHELEIGLITIHFWLDRRFIQPETISGKIEILKMLVDYAGTHEVVICLENMSEGSDDLALALQTAMGLGLTLDVGHGEILTPVNTSYDLIKNYSNRLYHVHLHDNRGGNRVEDDLHLPLGHGSIDFSSILKCLQSSGYDRTITLEIEPGYFLAGERFISRILHQADSNIG
jgi:sugar phosphate isomerase/epimerase